VISDWLEGGERDDLADSSQANGSDPSQQQDPGAGDPILDVRWMGRLLPVGMRGGEGRGARGGARREEAVARHAGREGS
jgi:hypothetical protein